jgi:hypothetical protein
VSEGVFGIESESAAERFAPALCEAITALEALQALEKVEIAFKPRVKHSSKNTWPTFSRKRMEQRASPLRTVARKVLDARMAELGFKPESGEEVFEAVAWKRMGAEDAEYVVIDRDRFSSAFHVGFSVGPPFTDSPARRRYAGLFVSNEDFENFRFASQAGLEAALADAFTRIASVGMEWFRNPHTRNWDEWKAIGIYFTQSLKPRPPRVRNLPG